MEGSGEADVVGLLLVCQRLKSKLLPHQRLSVLMDAGNIVTKMLQPEYCMPPTGWPQLLRCRKLVEDFRVAHHWSASATALLTEEGVTEDGCYFFFVCMCDYLLQSGVAYAHVEAPLEFAPVSLYDGICVVFPGKALSELCPAGVSCAYTALFMYEHCIDWLNSDMRHYVSALQKRAAYLLASHTTGESTMEQFESRRAQWACGSARLKLRAMATCSHGTGMVTPAPSEQVTLAQFDAWVVLAVTGWDGPRLREAVARAYKRRALRTDESGKNVAFAGQCTISRARGAMDATEEVLHSVELKDIAILADIHAVGLVRTLRDVTLMKLIDNALATKQISFMKSHLLLDSNRESLSQTNQSQHHLHIVETSGNFVVSGKQLGDGTMYPAGNSGMPTSFPIAFCTWYSLYFGERDPLEMK